MADNVDITPGTGATIATDQVVGGAQYQRVKLTDGTPDSENHAVVDSNGRLQARTLLTNGTVDVAVATDSLNVNYQRIRGNLCAVNMGAADTGTLRVAVSTDSTVGLVPVASGGLSISRVLSAASTNATSVKASAGQVYSIYAHNTNAAVRYLKIYNKASAPTVGTDTPVLTLPIPGNTAGAGFVLDTGGIGIAMATGIALAITTGVADSDTAAVAANEIVVNMLYK